MDTQQPFVSLSTLEDLWRERAKRAAYRYRHDSDQLTDVLSVCSPYHPIEATGAFAIRVARRRSSASLAEYFRVMKVFVDLVTEGVLPVEDPNSDRSGSAVSRG